MKNIVCISLLFATYCAHSGALSAGLIISKTQENLKPQCTDNPSFAKASEDTSEGKVAQERLPLFVTAEIYEQNFINAHAQCINAGDCSTNPAFEKARYEVLYSIYQLMDHLKELKKNTSDPDNKCEKVEAKDIKLRLTNLLKSIQYDY
jgi:hypothetical protein